MGELISKPTPSQGAGKLFTWAARGSTRKRGCWPARCFSGEWEQMWRLLTDHPPLTGSILHSGVHSPPPIPPGPQSSPRPQTAVLTGFQTTCCAMVQKGRQNSGDVRTWDGSSFSEEDNGIRKRPGHPASCRTPKFTQALSERQCAVIIMTLSTFQALY